MEQAKNLEIYKEIGQDYQMSASEVKVVRDSVAKGTNQSELKYFLSVCKTMELNPFNKEVWCYKDNRGNLLIFAGRDGFLSKAQRNPLFNGIRSAEVREKDEFSLDVANNEIKHVISKGQRGDIIGAYALVFRKDGEPTIEWSEFSTYNKGYNAWKTHPAEMIKKVAESHALKKAFGISGIQVEYEYSFDGYTANPINTKPLSFSQISYAESLIDSLNASNEKKEYLMRQLDSLTIDDYSEFVRELKEDQVILDPKDQFKDHINRHGI